MADLHIPMHVCVASRNHYVLICTYNNIGYVVERSSICEWKNVLVVAYVYDRTYIYLKAYIGI